MVNAIAPIFTNPDGLFLQTIYHPLRLYAEHAQAIALDPSVICETHALESDSAAGGREHRIADLGPFPLLDVSATRDEGGTALTLGIVNRHRDDAVTTTVEIGGGARDLQCGRLRSERRGSGRPQLVRPSGRGHRPGAIRHLGRVAPGADAARPTR